MKRRTGRTKRSSGSRACGAATTPRFDRCSRHASFRQGTDEQLRWFNDLCLKTVSPELAGPLLRARAEIDITALLTQVRTPTLVLHAREDARSADRRRPAARNGNPGRAVRGARVAQSRAARTRAGMGEVPGSRAGVHRTSLGVAGCGVQRSVEARAGNTGAARGGVEQLRDCRAPRHQREDGEKPPVASLRQAWGVVTRAGDCVLRAIATFEAKPPRTRAAPVRRRPRRRGRSTAC